MKFNLTEVKTSTPRLQPWSINDVKFAGVDYKKGTSSNGNNWAAMQFNFVGEGGTYSKMFFCPNEKGFERRTGETNGRSWTLPSDAEVTMVQIQYICQTLAKDAYAKVSGKISVDLPAEFEKLYTYVKQILSKANNETVQLKLVADSRGYADIPKNAVQIDNNDTAYIRNYWLGHNLAFTSYELKTRDAAKAEKPSEIDNLSDNNNSSDDIDLSLDL